ncbi:hypothetical protein FFWV33_15575 [Flavobacterium faecale]|uniref:HTH cro/C1-type domain-containing protein n=1 Tax=Flavobacterium faecale TaxID=1355330 RepID=A0A2S1LGG0_9FLAO|nr:helix-turn-helix transcriptional regulator [Flavobacterium faecale]AWG22845.1 hypothetical protein FFWV33_15575 [Flavobacterium faecale]
MIKITEYTISQFDFDLINHIKRLRVEKKISQEQLSTGMGLVRSFVGNVENINESHKYATRHLTLLAKAFGFKNISDLMRFPTPQYDKIKVIVKQTMNESGTKALSSEVVKIEPLK